MRGVTTNPTDGCERIDRFGKQVRMRTALLCLSLLATTAFAAQVVVTDVTYTHSAQTTSDSHYIVLPRAGTPSNWASPVDYAHGTAVVRLEVFTKPSATPTRFQICFEGSPSYACTNQAPAYTTTGVYTWTTPFPNFFQYSSVNWSQGVRDVALILKDTNNGKPAPENVGATESAKYMPTDLRVTVTLVSPGSTYVDPTVDAGTPDAGAVTPPPVDAGVPEFDAGTPPVVEVDAGAPEPVDAGVPEEVDAGAPLVVEAGVMTMAPALPVPEQPSAEPAAEPIPAAMNDEVVLGTGCSAGGVSLGLVALIGLMRRRRR